MFVAALALISARAAIRSQYLIMVVIGLSLLSFFFGSRVETMTVTILPIEQVGFWTVFAKWHLVDLVAFKIKASKFIRCSVRPWPSLDRRLVWIWN